MKIKRHLKITNKINNMMPKNNLIMNQIVVHINMEYQINNR